MGLNLVARTPSQYGILADAKCKKNCLLTSMVYDCKHIGLSLALLHCIGALGVGGAFVLIFFDGCPRVVSGKWTLAVSELPLTEVSGMSETPHQGAR